MEADSPFPQSGGFQPSVQTTEFAKKIASDVDTWAPPVDVQRPQSSDIIGVGLFKADGAVLEAWKPEKTDLNRAMNGAYARLLGAQPPAMGAPREYCNALLEDARIRGYLMAGAARWVDYQIIVHMHYYRSRTKEDPGFHKDTRGQTLFFMLHYLNTKPIYGAELRHDDGDLRLLDKGTGFTWALHQKKQKLRLVDESTDEVYSRLERLGALPPGKWTIVDSTGPGLSRIRNEAHEILYWDERSKVPYRPRLKSKPKESVEQLQLFRRTSPAVVDTVWPRDLREAVQAGRKADPNMHVLRIEPYGAALIVDDIVHHRTPSNKSRAEWGKLRDSEADQVSALQSYDEVQDSQYYKFESVERERGRSKVRESQEGRARSSSRSLSRERKKADEQPGGPESQRLANTFEDPAPRRFFRIWVTVSPKGKPVWY